MPMFPSLVEPIKQQLAAAERELVQLEESRKAKKVELRGLKKMLKEATREKVVKS